MLTIHGKLFILFGLITVAGFGLSGYVGWLKWVGWVGAYFFCATLVAGLFAANQREEDDDEPDSVMN